MSFNNNHSIVVNSAIATIIAELTTIPVCTVKTNYQNSHNIPVSKIIRNMYNQHGIKGFYKGSLAAMSSQVISTTCKYSLYKWFNNQQFKYSNKIIDGAASGLLVSLMTHPMDAIRVQYQMNNWKNFNLSFQNLYRGYSKAFMKTFVASSLFFPLYDYGNMLFNHPIKSALFSAIVSTVITHPFDYYKTMNIYNSDVYKNQRKQLNNIKNYKLNIFYKGLLVNYCRSIPHFTIVMTVISYLS